MYGYKAITTTTTQIPITTKGPSIPSFKCPDVNYNTRGRKATELREGVETWSACSNICRARSDCRYWTWHQENAGPYAYRCVTMSDVDERVADINAVSGTRSCSDSPIPAFKCPDYNHNTRDRENAVITDGIASWSACSNLCRERSDCRYWTWHQEDAGQYAFRCVTMSDVNSRVPDSNAVSGTKNCEGLTFS